MGSTARAGATPASASRTWPWSSSPSRATRRPRCARSPSTSRSPRRRSTTTSRPRKTSLVSIFQDLTQADRRPDRVGRGAAAHPGDEAGARCAATAQALAGATPLLPLHAGEPGDGARAEHRRDLQGPHAGACATSSATRTPPLTDQVRCVSALFTHARRDVRPAATSRATPRRSGRPSSRSPSIW